LGLTIDFEFFKESMNHFRWLDEQQRAIENIFNCDLYGGPMIAWSKELNMWDHILKKERSMGLLLSFASYYGIGNLTNDLSYEWDSDINDITEETLKLNVPITDDNWLKFVWETLLSIEGGENE
jgi:hypothetical protein